MSRDIPYPASHFPLGCGGTGGRGLTLRESPTADFERPYARSMAALIRKWRVRYGFTVYDVAQRAKISRQTLLNIERFDGLFSTVLSALRR